MSPGAGLALTSGSCDRASVGAASKISFRYDTLNRLTTTSYGDGSQGVSRTYTPDGLLSKLTSAGATWTLDYNRRRLPTTQVLTFGGRNYRLETLYDANGHASQLNYPSEGNPISPGVWFMLLTPWGVRPGSATMPPASATTRAARSPASRMATAKSGR